jgi:hypothetical protein
MLLLILLFNSFISNKRSRKQSTRLCWVSRRWKRVKHGKQSFLIKWIKNLSRVCLWRDEKRWKPRSREVRKKGRKRKNEYLSQHQFGACMWNVKVYNKFMIWNEFFSSFSLHFLVVWMFENIKYKFLQKQKFPHFTIF